MGRLFETPFLDRAVCAACPVLSSGLALGFVKRLKESRSIVRSFCEWRRRSALLLSLTFFRSHADAGVLFLSNC